jgi:hypothetical protein
MVPSALDADFNDVTRQFVMRPAEDSHFFRSRDAATMSGKAGSKDVRNVDQLRVLADRAVVLSFVANVGGGSNQFGVSVANISLRQAFTVELVDEMAPGHPVIDSAGPHPRWQHRSGFDQ